MCVARLFWWFVFQSWSFFFTSEKTHHCHSHYRSLLSYLFFLLCKHYLQENFTGESQSILVVRSISKSDFSCFSLLTAVWYYLFPSSTVAVQMTARSHESGIMTCVNNTAIVLSMSIQFQRSAESITILWSMCSAAIPIQLIRPNIWVKLAWCYSTRRACEWLGSSSVYLTINQAYIMFLFKSCEYILFVSA